MGLKLANLHRISFAAGHQPPRGLKRARRSALAIIREHRILGHCGRKRREYSTPELHPKSAIADVNGCFAGTYFVVRMPLVGRQCPFADGGSGRSCFLSGLRRSRGQLDLSERSLSRRDRRLADDCCVADTGHRGRGDSRVPMHRPAALPTPPNWRVLTGLLSRRPAHGDDV